MTNIAIFVFTHTVLMSKSRVGIMADGLAM